MKFPLCASSRRGDFRKKPWIEEHIECRDCCTIIPDPKNPEKCQCGLEIGLHEPTAEKRESGKWDYPVHTQRVPCNAYGRIKFLDEDVHQQPEFARVDVDYYESGRIGKIMELLDTGCVVLIQLIQNNQSMCQCGLEIGLHEPTAEKRESGKWDYPVHTQRVPCNAYGRIKFLDEDVHQQPEFARVDVDYYESGRIGKIMELLDTGCVVLIQLIQNNQSM
eukprot:sb/3469850/